MSDAPEKIWVSAFTMDVFHYKPFLTATEYVRADRIKALEAENKRLREAVQAEREACAKVAEDMNTDIWEYSTGNRAPIVGLFDPVATAIRARGERND